MVGFTSLQGVVSPGWVRSTSGIIETIFNKHTQPKIAGDNTCNAKKFKSLSKIKFNYVNLPSQ